MLADNPAIKETRQKNGWTKITAVKPGVLFGRFRDSVNLWLRRWGLTHYRTFFEVVPLEDAFANTTVYHQECVVRFRWNAKASTMFGVDPQLTGFHEACEVLLMDLRQALLRTGIYSPDYVDRLIHTTIRRLEGGYERSDCRSRSR